jgi:hypothetical protein
MSVSCPLYCLLAPSTAFAAVFATDTPTSTCEIPAFSSVQPRGVCACNRPETCAPMWLTVEAYSLHATLALAVDTVPPTAASQATGTTVAATVVLGNTSGLGRCGAGTYTFQPTRVGFSLMLFLVGRFHSTDV